MRTALVVAILWAGAANAQPSLFEQANALHKEGFKEHDAAKLARAHELYQQYLAKSADDADATASFYDAELLFNLQRYDDAATMYERVTTLAPKGRFASQAAYAFVIAAKNAVKPAARDGGPPCPDLKPCAIAPDRRRLLAAFDRYLALVADGPERPIIEYRKAKLLYDEQHFAEAAPIFDHVFVAYAGNELATYAANLEMDCWALLKREHELRALVERVKKSPIMNDATTRQQVRDNEAALKKLGK